MLHHEDRLEQHQEQHETKDVNPGKESEAFMLQRSLIPITSHQHFSKYFITISNTDTDQFEPVPEFLNE
jgi:hypothetical protein